MQQLSFAPDAPPPHKPVEALYEALEAKTADIAYGEVLGRARTRSILEAAHQVVRAEVHYDDYGLSQLHRDPHDGFIDEAYSNRATNCLGLDVALSTLLEEAGVRHWLGYTTGHAFMVVNSSEGPLFVDSISSTATAPICLRECSGLDAPVVETQTILAVHVDEKYRIAAQTRQAKTDMVTDARLIEHPWDKITFPIRYRLIESGLGRQALRAFETVWHSLGDQDLKTATSVFKDKAAIYPEIETDIRFNNTFRGIRAAISQRMSNGARLTSRDAKRYEKVINAYCDILEQDGFTAQTKGDLLRLLGNVTSDKTWLTKAQEAYEDGIQKPGGSYLPEKSRAVSKALANK